jgi:hypothetical protein
MDLTPREGNSLGTGQRQYSELVHQKQGLTSYLMIASIRAVLA